MTETSAAQRCDVVVIGAGPAGTTAAALLAREGLDTIIVDADAFPRFSIGESLLPIVLPVFSRLGWMPSQDRYQFKRGADFFDDRDGRRSRFAFEDGLEGTPTHAFHVERALFDKDLLDHAVRLGARAHMRTPINRVTFGADHVLAESSDVSVHARYLVDATGRKALTGRQFGSIRPIRGFGIAAAYAHFTNVPDAFVKSVQEDGNVVIVAHEDGWGWMIPLKGPCVSVGLVVNKKVISQSYFSDYIRSSRYFAPIVQNASGTEVTLTGNFSFVNDAPHGARYVAVGDAATFLDPVLSSGVSLGMVGAADAATRISEAFRAEKEGDPSLMEEHHKRMRRGYETFGSSIHRFYNTKIVDNLFFATDADPTSRAGVISVLAGDVWRDDNAYQNGILQGRHHWKLDLGMTEQQRAAKANARPSVR